MIQIDSFSGAASDIKKKDRTIANLILVIEKAPMISTWDFSENKWLWQLVREAKEQELIEELNQPYPWHKYKITAKGREILNTLANA